MSLFHCSYTCHGRDISSPAVRSSFPLLGGRVMFVINDGMELCNDEYMFLVVDSNFENLRV